MSNMQILGTSGQQSNMTLEKIISEGVEKGKKIWALKKVKTIPPITTCISLHIPESALPNQKNIHPCNNYQL